MIIFITGGCKNGKTSIAEKIVYNCSDKKNIFYIATMVPSDDEDILRIKKHIEERSKYCFKTIEIDTDTLVLKNLKGWALFDSITALLMNYFCKYNDRDNYFDMIKPALDNFINNKNLNLVIISDYIYENSTEMNLYTKQYLKDLSLLDRYVAECADVVIEVIYGNLKYYKGKEYAEKINSCI